MQCSKDFIITNAQQCRAKNENCLVRPNSNHVFGMQCQPPKAGCMFSIPTFVFESQFVSVSIHPSIHPSHSRLQGLLKSVPAVSTIPLLGAMTVKYF